MASQKWGQKDSGQYSVYNPPTSNLDLLRTRGDKYENTSTSNRTMMGR